MATYDVNALLSATAYGSDGDKIGKVEQVFLDDNTTRQCVHELSPEA